MTRPDFVNFILEDTHSRVLRDYITELENKVDELNDKIEELQAINEQHRLLNGELRIEAQNE